MGSIASGRIDELERIAQAADERLGAGWELGAADRPGIRALGSAAAGGLAAAAAAVAGTPQPRVVLITGVYVAGAPAPAAETDGPAGAAMLAGGLRALGADVRLLTDTACAPVVRAVGEAVSVLTLIADTPGEVAALGREFRAEGVTHVIAIERLGPAADGAVYNMRGHPQTEQTAPLHELMIAVPWTTIAIGDGGNEIGMGSLPRELVAAEIDHGARICCVVPADHLIVGRISNWSAVALLLAIGLSDPARLRAVVPFASPELHRRLVRLSVTRAGALDGLTGAAQATVDGLSLSRCSAVIDALLAACLPRGGEHAPRRTGRPI